MIATQLFELGVHAIIIIGLKGAPPPFAYGSGTCMDIYSYPLLL